MKFFTVILCAVGVLIDLSSSAETVDYRLNTNIEPFDYVIEFTPYFNSTVDGKKPFTFDGQCAISLKTNQPDVDAITLHKHDLEIFEHSLTSKSENITIVSSNFDNVTDKYTLKLAQPLVKDEAYVLSFKYTGNLRNDMIGFYRSSYKNDNDTKWLASTKFEPFHARKVFPCFDEPRFKATFSIIINRPDHFKPSICNTPLVSSRSTASNMVRERFEKTPKMSTYLVAFIVSEFDCRENSMKDFFVCSRPNAYNQTEYSFDFGQKMLRKFDEYFDSNYSTYMAQMTLAAIPDFAAGAMENWGLLTYRETALLVDPEGVSARQLQRVAAVVAHEQTHMWFGDLVTCDWWSNLWLNEGFARYFQYFGNALIESGWGLEQQFVVDQIHKVLADDSLESSLSLSHTADNPDDILLKFDSISYNKGASVIRMFKHMLGETKFIAGLRNYLKINALQTAIPDDLYAAFQTQVGTEYNVTEVMGSWVSQPGYPVLDVKVKNDFKTVEISQHRYLQNNPSEENGTLWTVPITYATDKTNCDFSDTKFQTLLSNNSIQIELNDTIDWIVFNVQQTGYYRVNYNADGWSAIAKLLHRSHSSIHVINRAQIIDDIFNLARSNDVDYKTTFNLILYLKNEIDYVPWTAAFDGFQFILNRFTADDAHVFQKFLLGLLNKVYNHLGFQAKNSDTHLDVFNRNNVLKHACRLGHAQCIADARAEYDKLLDGNHTIPNDLRPVVYCTVISQGSDDEWNFLWNKFRSVNSAAEQSVILSALGCTKQAHLIEKFFKLVFTDEIRLQDKYSALTSTLHEQCHLSMVLDLVIAKYKDINSILTTKNKLSFLKQLLTKSTTHEQVDKIREFFKANDLLSNKQIKTALKQAEMNLKWAEKNIPIIKDCIGSMDTEV